MTSKVGRNMKPLDAKRLHVRNTHQNLETNKKIGDMRKKSNSVLHAYDKDIDEIRQRYGDLKASKTKSPVLQRKTVTNPPKPAVKSRDSSLKVTAAKKHINKSTSDLARGAPKISSTKSLKTGTDAVKSTISTSKTIPKTTIPKSRTSDTSGPQTRGTTSTGATKKKTSGPGSSMKKKNPNSTTSKFNTNNTKKVISRKTSHFEVVVYNPTTDDKPTVHRGRSVSMFETHTDLPRPQPGLEEREMSQIAEEGEDSDTSNTFNTESGGSRSQSMTLDEAVLQLGGDCPYKDLIS